MLRLCPLFRACSMHPGAIYLAWRVLVARTPAQRWSKAPSHAKPILVAFEYMLRLNGTRRDVEALPVVSSVPDSPGRNLPCVEGACRAHPSSTFGPKGHHMPRRYSSPLNTCCD